MRAGSSSDPANRREDKAYRLLNKRRRAFEIGAMKAKLTCRCDKFDMPPCPLHSLEEYYKGVLHVPSIREEYLLRKKLLQDWKEWVKANCGDDDTVHSTDEEEEEKEEEEEATVQEQEVAK
jgi:hypothetical protein